MEVRGSHPVTLALPSAPPAHGSVHRHQMKAQSRKSPAGKKWMHRVQEDHGSQGHTPTLALPSDSCLAILQRAATRQVRF